MLLLLGLAVFLRAVSGKLSHKLVPGDDDAGGENGDAKKPPMRIGPPIPGVPRAKPIYPLPFNPPEGFALPPDEDERMLDYEPDVDADVDDLAVAE